MIVRARIRLCRAFAPILSLLFVSACGSVPPPSTTAERTQTDPVASAADGPPIAEVRPTANTYHGDSVADPYQWLEDPEAGPVRAWSDAQNQYARRMLEDLPGRRDIGQRVREILGAPTRGHRNLVQAGGKLFAFERRPPREQPFLVVMDSADDPDGARILVDPAVLDPEGGIAIDWFVPSPNGRLVAVSLSQGGSERGDLHIFDVATGEEVHEVIDHVQNGTAGGDVAWLPDASGFYYTRYPREGERPAADLGFYQQVYFHALGSSADEDRYELGRDLPRIAEIRLEMHHASGRLLTTVQNGDGGEFAMYLRDRGGAWRQFSSFDDGHVQASFGPHNDLYVVSRRGAPRGKVLRVPISRLDLARATEIIPEGQDSIVTDFWDGPTVIATPTRLVTIYQVGGPNELRLFDLRGRPLPSPEQPAVSAIRTLVPLGGEALLFRLESFVEPTTWYQLDGAGSAPRATALRESSPVDSSGWQVRREMATSSDGTEVPLNILLPPGATMGEPGPCVVTGYGGYGVNIEPHFRPLNDVYLSAGVTFVVVNLRGGAEFGEAWHDAGRLTHKQNVFDDFAAALRHLIERGYTRPDRLGIIGGSNGGLLMGATLTQHPELAHVVVSYVGIYDMLRVELSPNGAFNVTEFGTVEDADQYRALRAYSPYHNVRAGVAYPATLFLTGANDPRVEPWHSRKMVARLQAAQAGDAAILLRTSDSSGHGIGTALSEEIAETTDVVAFLFAQLGVRMPGSDAT